MPGLAARGIILALVIASCSPTKAVDLKRFNYNQFYVSHWILGPSEGQLRPPLQVNASLRFWPTLPRPIFNPWEGETRLTPPREVWPTVFSPWDGRWGLKNVAFSLGENPEEEYFGKSPDFKATR
jgi:hypothetical protein